MQVRDEPGAQWRTVKLSSAIKALVVLNLQVRAGDVECGVRIQDLEITVWGVQVRKRWQQAATHAHSLQLHVEPDVLIARCATVIWVAYCADVSWLHLLLSGADRQASTGA